MRASIVGFDLNALHVENAIRYARYGKLDLRRRIVVRLDRINLFQILSREKRIYEHVEYNKLLRIIKRLYSRKNKNSNLFIEN